MAGFRVHAFGRPSELELRHDFLARVAARPPERGKIGIFNRSHYKEVLVVRGYPAALARQRLPDAGAKDFRDCRFESIREFERHLARNGTVIVRFWLNVSHEQQKERLLERIDDKDYMRAAVARILVGTLEGVNPGYPVLGAAEGRELEAGRKRLRDE